MRKHILAAFAVNLLVVAFVALGAYAWGYDGTITFDGIDRASDNLFGGIGAAGSWVVALAILAGLAVAHNKMIDKGNRDGATVLMVVSVVVASFGVSKALQAPTSQIWALGGLLVIAGLLTGVMWILLVHNRVPGWSWLQAKRAQRRARQAQRPANDPILPNQQPDPPVASAPDPANP